MERNRVIKRVFYSLLKYIEDSQGSPGECVVQRSRESLVVLVAACRCGVLPAPTEKTSKNPP